jgi:hypothetical protein
MLLCNWPVHMGFMLKSLGHEPSPWFFTVPSAKWEDRMLIRLRLLSNRVHFVIHQQSVIHAIWFGYLPQNAVYFITFFLSR